MSSVDFEYRNSAFSRRMSTFAVKNRDHIDIKDFLEDSFYYFCKEILEILDQHTSVKVNTCFCATFEKTIVGSKTPKIDFDGDDAEQPIEKKEKQTIYIHTKSVIVDRHTDFLKLFNDTVIIPILQKVDDMMIQGSGFTLSSINELLVQINRYDPIRGASFIDLPKYLKAKHAIVNIVNNDNMCFKWAILSALYPATSNPSRLSNYLRYGDELDFRGIDFPVRVKDIEKFENQNQTISVNVFIFDDNVKKLQPLRTTKEV